MRQKDDIPCIYALNNLALSNNPPRGNNPLILEPATRSIHANVYIFFETTQYAPGGFRLAYVYANSRIAAGDLLEMLPL